MIYLICDVRVSELLTKQVSLAPWEVLVLQALHGNNIKVVGEEEINRDPPSAAEEYQRLCNKYRGNKEDQNSVVAAVFGPFEAGIANLRQQMRAAGVEPYEDDGLDAITVPVVRSSRMATGVRGQQAQRARATQTARTAGTPGSSPRVKPTPTPLYGSVEQRKEQARDARRRFEIGRSVPAATPATARSQRRPVAAR